MTRTPTTTPADAKPMTRHIVAAHFLGTPLKDIAARLGLNPCTCTRHLHSPAGKAYLRYLHDRADQAIVAAYTAKTLDPEKLTAAGILPPAVKAQRGPRVGQTQNLKPQQPGEPRRPARVTPPDEA